MPDPDDQKNDQTKKDDKLGKRKKVFKALKDKDLLAPIGQQVRFEDFQSALADPDKREKFTSFLKERDEIGQDITPDDIEGALLPSGDIDFMDNLPDPPEADETVDVGEDVSEEPKDSKRDEVDKSFEDLEKLSTEEGHLQWETEQDAKEVKRQLQEKLNQVNQEIDKLPKQDHPVSNPRISPLRSRDIRSDEEKQKFRELQKRKNSLNTQLAKVSEFLGEEFAKQEGGGIERTVEALQRGKQAYNNAQLAEEAFDAFNDLSRKQKEALDFSGPIPKAQPVSPFIDSEKRVERLLRRLSNTISEEQENGKTNPILETLVGEGSSLQTWTKMATEDPLGFIGAISEGAAESLFNMAPTLAAGTAAGVGTGFVTGNPGAANVAARAAMGFATYDTEYAHALSQGIRAKAREMDIDASKPRELIRLLNDRQAMREIDNGAAAKAAVVAFSDMAGLALDRIPGGKTIIKNVGKQALKMIGEGGIEGGGEYLSQIAKQAAQGKEINPSETEALMEGVAGAILAPLEFTAAKSFQVTKKGVQKTKKAFADRGLKDRVENIAKSKSKEISISDEEKRVRDKYDGDTQDVVPVIAERLSKTQQSLEEARQQDEEGETESVQRLQKAAETLRNDLMAFGFSPDEVTQLVEKHSPSEESTQNETAETDETPEETTTIPHAQQEIGVEDVEAIDLAEQKVGEKIKVTHETPAGTQQTFSERVLRKDEGGYYVLRSGMKDYLEVESKEVDGENLGIFRSGFLVDKENTPGQEDPVLQKYKDERLAIEQRLSEAIADQRDGKISEDELAQVAEESAEQLAGLRKRAKADGVNLKAIEPNEQSLVGNFDSEKVRKAFENGVENQSRVRKKLGDSFQSADPDRPGKLVHFSTKDEILQTIDPERQGEGVPGAETIVTTKVSYYYRMGSEPERLVTGNAKKKYVVEPDDVQVYDLGRDPEGIVEQSMEENGGAFNRSDVYSKIKAAGYDGFYRSDSKLPNAVALFSQQNVKEAYDVTPNDRRGNPFDTSEDPIPSDPDDPLVGQEVSYQVENSNGTTYQERGRVLSRVDEGSYQIESARSGNTVTKTEDQIVSRENGRTRLKATGQESISDVVNNTIYNQYRGRGVISDEQAGQVSGSAQEKLNELSSRGVVDPVALGRYRDHLTLQEKMNRGIVEEATNIPNRMQGSVEAVPSTSIGFMEGIFDAPFEDRARYTRDMLSALTDKSGENIVFKMLGLQASTESLFNAPGPWEGEVNPSGQVEQSLQDLTDADQQTVKAALSAIGYLFRQDAVGYHRPFEVDTRSKADGMEYMLGSSPKPEELNAVLEGIDQEFGDQADGVAIVPSRTGIRALNISGMDNVEFQNRVRSAITGSLSDDIQGDVRYFGTDNGLIFNNWSDQSNGENYLREIGKIGRPDLERAVHGVLSKRIAQVNKQYARRFDWGENPTRFERQINLAEAVQQGRLSVQEANDIKSRMGLRFKKAQESYGPKLSLEKLSNLVEGLNGTFSGLNDVILVEDMSGLPEEVRIGIKESGQELKVKGVWYDGNVYMVASNIDSLTDAVQTIFHELIGHEGINQLLGDKIFDTMVDVWNSFKSDPRMQKIVQTYGLDTDTLPGQVEAAEEFIAHMAETSQKPELIERVVAKVKQFIRDTVRNLGFNPSFLQMTDGDIRTMIADARQIAHTGTDSNIRNAVRYSKKAGIPDPARGSSHAIDTIRDLAETLGMNVRQGRISGPGELKGETIRLQSIADIETFAGKVGQHLLDNYREHLELTEEHINDIKSAYGLPNAAGEVDFNQAFELFMQKVITAPQHVDNTIPETLKHVVDSLDNIRPGLASDIVDIQDSYNSWINAPSEQKAESEIQTKPTKFEKFKQGVKDIFNGSGFADKLQIWAESIYRNRVDSMYPLKKAVDQLKDIYQENNGFRKSLKAAENAYKLMRLSVGSFLAGKTDLTFGVENYHTYTNEGPSLAEALRIALNGDWSTGAMNSFGSYLASKRITQEWERYNNGDIPNKPSKASKIDHEANVRVLEAENPQFAVAAEMVNEWNQNMWKKMYDAGLVDSDLYKRARDVRDFYVPLKRVRDDKTLVDSASESAGAGRITFGFKGSERDIINPIESMFEQAFHVNQIIKRNDAVKALHELAKAAGAGGEQIVEQVRDTQAHPIQVDFNNVLEKIKSSDNWDSLGERDAFLDAMDASLIDDMDIPRASIYRTGRIRDNGEPVVYYYRDGERVALQLADGDFGKELYNVLTGMHREAAGTIAEFLAPVSESLRYGVTTDPTFLAANFFRDQFSTWVLTDVGYLPGVDFARGISSELSDVFDRENVADEMARLYRSTGAKTGVNRSALDEERLRGSIESLERENILTRELSGDIGSALAEFTDLSETGTRIGLFRKTFKDALDRGMSRKEAAIEAAYTTRDLIDFDRVGAKMVGWRKITPFMNAAIQGIEKGVRNIRGDNAFQRLVVRRRAQSDSDLGGTARAVSDFVKLAAPFVKHQNNIPLNEEETRMLGRSAKTVARTFMLGIIGSMISSALLGDEEYDEIDKSYIRPTHWVIPWSGSQAAEGGEGRIWLRFPKPFEFAVVSNIMEIAIEGAYYQDEQSIKRLGKSLTEVLVPPVMPQAAKIGLGVLANKDFFSGRPVVPSHLTNRPPQFHVNEYTSELAKWLGGDTVSPMMIDFLIQNTLGSMGESLKWMSNLTRDEQPATPWDEKFFVRRFLWDSDKMSFSQKNFFERMNRFSSSTNLIESGIGIGDNVWGQYQAFRTLAEGDNPEEALEFLDNLDESSQHYVLRTFALKSLFDDNLADTYDDHPLNRSYWTARTFGDMKAQISTDESEDNITRRKKRRINELLDRLQTIEYRNALAASDMGSHENRDLQDPTEVINSLEEVAPDVYQKLRNKFFNKGYDINNLISYKRFRRKFRNGDFDQFIQNVKRDIKLQAK